MKKKWVSIRDKKVSYSELSKIDEIKGKLQFDNVDDKLMHSVLENDKETIDEGKLIKDAVNQNLASFTPDLMFEQFVKDYRMAKSIYGESIIRQISGYDPNYIEKNIRIPEFQKELKKKISDKVDALKKKGIIDKQDMISEKGLELASLIIYTEELDNIVPKGMFGEKANKKYSVYGDKENIKDFKKTDRYRDIALKRAVKNAVKRGHKEILVEDLKSFERTGKGQVYVIYGLDSSGSMKGKKIDVSKKAGIALAYRAIEEQDKVGLIVFGDKIKKIIEPTNDFSMLLKEITKIRPGNETNLVSTIQKSIELFPNEDVTKHLILLTDVLPTVGKEPEKETLEAVSLARSNGITISVAGINLDAKGKMLAKKICEIGQGRFYVIKDLENMDKIILEDYYSVV